MKLSDLKGCGENRTIVFAGNGTTLNEFALDKIVHPLAASNFFLPFGPAKWGRRPDFYFAHDPSVLFASWETHRRFKRLPAPPGYDVDIAALTPASVLHGQWALIKAILPADLGWWAGFDSKVVLRDVDRAACDHWLYNHRPAFYAYEPVRQRPGWGLRLRRRLRGFKRPDFDPRGWAPTWLDRLLDPLGPRWLSQLDQSRVPLWGLNSFCSVILPILLWMGWQRILLVGVDFDKQGYFFNPYQSPTGQQFFYREEFEEFFHLCAVARSLRHRPLIQAVRASRNAFRPPDGLVEFEECVNSPVSSPRA